MVYRKTERVVGRIADTRARILSAARAIVAEEGWAAATVSNVANRAGIATGTVYRHWASKADLCVEVVASVSAHEISVMSEIAASPAPPAEKLASMVSTFLRRALRGRRLAYALIAEPCDPEVEEVRLDYRAQLAHCIEGILREAVATGELESTDCAVSAACIVGAFMEALVGPLAPFRHHGKDEDSLLIKKITMFCLRVGLTPSTRLPVENSL